MTNYYWDREKKELLGSWNETKDGEYWENRFTINSEELEKKTKKFMFVINERTLFRFWDERGSRRIYDEFGRESFIGDFRRNVIRNCWIKIIENV
jgi:hypothetical protein